MRLPRVSLNLDLRGIQRLVPSPRGLGRMLGQALGGVLVASVGIALGLLFGHFLGSGGGPKPAAPPPAATAAPDAPMAAPAAIARVQPLTLPPPTIMVPAVAPPTPGAPPPAAPSSPAAQPPAAPGSSPAVAAPVAVAPTPKPVDPPAGEEPYANGEPKPRQQQPAPPPVLFEAADAPSLDLAALPAAMAVSPSPPRPVVTPPVPEGPAQPQWLRNAVAFSAVAGRPLIAVVFDDLGLDRKRTDRVIALPGPLTLSFLPYAGDLLRQTRAGRAAGHELMVHVPMEPLASHLDPGPGTLAVNLAPDEILKRLDKDLAAFDGYVGINNHMGSRFTSDRAAMLPVLSELKRRGLLFLDSVTAGTTVGPALAAALAVPNASRNVFLDDDLAPAAVQASLARLEQIARQQGLAVAIGHPHDVTLDAVSAWLPGLAAKGFALAPVSAIVRARGWPADPSRRAAAPPSPSPAKGHIHG